VNLVDPAEIIGDILKFKGFIKSSFKDKLKWIFILYPFALVVVAYHLILWIPYFIDAFKRDRKNTSKKIRKEGE
jgi:hypothetical protein